MIFQKLLCISEKTELASQLMDHGFQVRQIERFPDAMEALSVFIPDIIILDAGGSELFALEFCTSVKSLNRFKTSVIIFLSELNNEILEVAAFKAGADDFITVPVKINALVERINVRLKKPTQSITIALDRFDTTPLKIDRESYSVYVGNELIRLSKKEFELLYLMASQPEKLFRRDEIFRLVWNKKSIGKNRTLDVHILHLRQKLGNRFIATQKGIGYRFVI